LPFHSYFRKIRIPFTHTVLQQRAGRSRLSGGDRNHGRTLLTTFEPRATATNGLSARILNLAPIRRPREIVNIYNVAGGSLLAEVRPWQNGVAAATVARVAGRILSR